MTTEQMIRIAAEVGARAALGLLDKCAEGSMKDTINDIVRTAAKSGADALAKEKASIRKREKGKAYDRRLYNTRLLLKNYLGLKAHCENAVYSLEDSDKEDTPTAGEIWEIMNDGYSSEAVYVESIRRSAMRTMIIVQHIERILGVYEAYCDKSPMQSVKRQFRVLKSKYLVEEPMSVAAVAEAEHIHPRTVDKDLDAAVESVTALLFGIDAIDAGRVRA